MEFFHSTTGLARKLPLFPFNIMKPRTPFWPMWSIVEKYDQNMIIAAFASRYDCMLFLNKCGLNPDDYIIDYCMVLDRKDIIREVPYTDFSIWK
jgi:hypothetical protein